VEDLISKSSLQQAKAGKSVGMQDNADKPSGGPNVIALPPLILAAALVLGLILNFAWPAKFLAREFSAEFSAPVGVFVILSALAIAGLAVREMIGAGTPLDVRKAPSRIVTSGIFRRSRNPIYLGMILLYAGMAILLNSLWLLVLVPVLAVILQKGVIEREEAYLERNFGEEYRRYKAHVRRWV
jgi:protein-S-isoprenylcysteine O-methyltransferase Ste14